MFEKSNLTDIIQEVGEENSQSNNHLDINKSKLAILVDKQLNKRGNCIVEFTKDEKALNYERELLGPKFYQEILKESDIDFWNVFQYASCYLYDETGAHLHARHPAEVEKLFEILTGESNFVKAVQFFFMDVFPTHTGFKWEGITPVLCTCCYEANQWYSLNELKTYFALELTDAKLDKLEVLMENVNAYKVQAFKLDDQFADRENNMDTISRLLDSMGSESKELVFPLILNELRVNPRDIFRYYFHRDLCLSLIWGGGTGANRGGINIPARLPLHKCENFDEFMKIMGVEYKAGDSEFWTKLITLMKSLIQNRELEYSYFFSGLEDGYRGWGMGDNFDYKATTHYQYASGNVREDAYFMISCYGAEATKDRLDAIFTQEVLEVLLEEFGFLSMSERDVEKKLKELRKKGHSEENYKDNPKKRGFFGLFGKKG